MAEIEGFEPPRILLPNSFRNCPLQPLGYISVINIFRIIFPRLWISSVFLNFIQQKLCWKNEKVDLHFLLLLIHPSEKEK
ncbi:hypothetical protein GvMRE_IIg422 [endosymbiont GvMRE of Glomus versiforme]|nr:hypothetical protein GvMRE_IIg422 [endosymbiont GvMRE of Glomus versiforme]